MACFDEGKTLAAMLYLVKKAGGRLDLYALVKLLYFADKKHLHEWGRTITGDHYAKMEHGPTPSAAYDMLKSVRGDKDWETDLSPFFTVSGNMVIAMADPDLDELAESELQILDQVFAEDGGKSFFQLRAKAHDKAYQNAKCHWMTEEDLAEDNSELIAHVRKTAEDDRFLEGW